MGPTVANDITAHMTATLHAEGVMPATPVDLCDASYISHPAKKVAELCNFRTV
jgi:hypothetical protein